MATVGEQVLELYNKDTAQLDELQAIAVSEEATLAQHQDFNIAFDKSRKEFEEQAKAIQATVEERIAKAEADEAAAKSATTADRAATTKLNQELAAANEKLVATEAETKDLNSKLATLAESKPSATALTSIGTEEVDFYDLYGAVLVDVKTVLYRAKNNLPAEEGGDLTALETRVTELEGKASSNVFGSQEATQEVRSLFDQARAALVGADEVAPSSTEMRLKNTTAYEDFVKESGKLLQWCRQQKTDLEALTEPDLIQKFCTALEGNYKTMYDNFEMLCSMGQDLMPNVSVEKTLMECNEVWLNLQIFAHEVLQHTMLEIHARSKLEDEVRAFSTYSTRFNETLKSLHEMFSLPMDDESKAVVASVLEQTEQLQKDFMPHLLLSDHLKEFSLRMECLRDNYNNLRRTVFARLTFLSQQQLPLLNTSHRRRDEYLSRMRELRTWVDKKDQGESCSDMYDRVLKMKDLIDKEYEHVRRMPSEVVSTQTTGAEASNNNSSQP
eukprot:PhM_4_TR5643/c0_g1_i1/m.65725